MSAARMREVRFKCFVIMPFAPELHYFYLYLKQYIERKYGIQCDRGDADVSTRPLLDKINEYIQTADVIIADCSGRNPNVFYELGIAHAYNKRVILITKDPVQEAPTDIRFYEFIHYELERHTEFFDKLDNALFNVFMERYEDLYERGKTLFYEFRQQTHAHVELISKRIFLLRVMPAEQSQELPVLDSDSEVREFILPHIITDVADITTLNQITDWLEKKRKAP